MHEMAMKRRKMFPAACLLAAAMSGDSLHAAHVLPDARIVDDPALLGSVARAALAELAQSR